MTRILSIALLAAAAFAADPIATGTWTLTGDVQGYPINESCVLTQTDAAIAGTCTDSAKVDRVVTGKVTDKGFTFSHPSEYQGDPLTLTFAGALDPTGKLSGTIDVQPLDYQGTFSATKAAAAPKQ